MNAIRTHPRTVTVADVMTRDVVTVLPTASFKTMVELMQDLRIGALPVVAPGGRLVGIVTEGDLIVKEAARLRDVGLGWLVGRLRRGEREKATGTDAAAVMSSPVVTVADSAAPAVAARLMQREGVKHLPVIDENGRLAGMVSRVDVLKVFARADDDIRRDIDEVIRRGAWVDPERVEVRVDDGVVHLAGRLERRSEVELLCHLVASLEGVVSLEEELGFEFDDSTKAPPAPARVGPVR